MCRSLARPILVVLGYLVLAGCAGTSPQALGLTGAPVPAPPAAPDTAQLGVPGVGGMTAPDLSTPSMGSHVLEPGDFGGAAPGEASPTGQ